MNHHTPYSTLISHRRVNSREMKSTMQTWAREGGIEHMHQHTHTHTHTHTKQQTQTHTHTLSLSHSPVCFDYYQPSLLSVPISVISFIANDQLSRCAPNSLARASGVPPLGTGGSSQ